MKPYFEATDLAVGYHGKILIHDIRAAVEKGKILTLIGPNGAGKSTILKSIIKNIPLLRGSVQLDGQDIAQWSEKEMARRVAVVLTDRIAPELMTCTEVVALGRYPYTNLLGHLSARDKEIIHRALEQVHGLELANQDFSTLSDGQKQRILLARAICQQPEVIVLDEPTAYLDIRHKVEFLEILRGMARDQGITVIMSLHEVDLAAKVSDYLMCVKGETIDAFGPPETVLQPGTVPALYDMEKGSYNLLFGSVELSAPDGPPQAFVVAGGGQGIPVYRILQKRGIPFASGVLFENDIDWMVASALSSHVVSVPAFEEITQQALVHAKQLLKECRFVVDAGTVPGHWNQRNSELLCYARQLGKPLYTPQALLQAAAEPV